MLVPTLFLMKTKKKFLRERNIFTAVTSIRIESNKILINQ